MRLDLVMKCRMSSDYCNTGLDEYFFPRGAHGVLICKTLEMKIDSNFVQFI